MTAGSMALLKVKNGEVGFQKSTSKQIAAGSAYIPYSEEQETFRVLKIIEDGIESPTLSRTSEDARYDLMGRKLPKGQSSSIMIVNHKKILNK